MNKTQPDRAIAAAVGSALLVVLAGAWLVLPGDAPAPDADADAAGPVAPQELEHRITTTAGSSQSERRGAATLADAVPGQAADPAARATQARDEEQPGDQNAATSPASEQDIPAEFVQPLSEVVELLNAGRYDEATVRLDELMTAENMAKMTPFARSRVYMLSFNLNMQAENYEGASADLQAALESGGLDTREYNDASYQRAQLFVQMEDYAKAADSLELWIADQRAEPRPAAYYLLASSYYYQDKFDDARDHMETMMSMPGEKQEAWYQMMAALYMQDSDYAKAKPVVEKLVELFDDPRYRDQLTGINAELAKSR